jgi:hypothetical protein
MDKKTKRIKKKIPKQKQKQKQKVIQKVNVSVSSSGGSGGSTMPSNYPSHQMMPNFISSNEQEKNIIKSLVDLLKKDKETTPQDNFNIPQGNPNIPQPPINLNIPQPPVNLNMPQPQGIFNIPQKRVRKSKNVNFGPTDTQTDPIETIEDTNRVLNTPIDTSNFNLMQRVNPISQINKNEGTMTIYQPPKQQREGYSIHKELAPKLPKMVINEMLNDFNKPLMEDMKKQRINYYGGQKTAEPEQQMTVPIKKLSQQEDELLKTIKSLEARYNDADRWGRGHITRKLNALNEEIKNAEKDVSNYTNYKEPKVHNLNLSNIGPLATTQQENKKLNIKSSVKNPLKIAPNSWITKK